MPNALELIEDAKLRLEAANLFYGHGTENAEDDAIFLVLHALGLAYDASQAALEAPVSLLQISALESLLEQRISKRMPSAYVTQRMWFAGLEFYVDQRVLVPRSPLGELILGQFAPWVDAGDVHRILEIGTGSGCIALALAHYFPEAEVFATDISDDALAVATLNLERHADLKERVSFVNADLFPESAQNSTRAELALFDLIVTNPPYVPESQMAALPEEYLNEPGLALLAGEDGLEFINRILNQAHAWLKPDGAIFFDVGNRWPVLDKAYPELSFTWCELERGGEGIGMIDALSLSKLR